MTTLKWWVDRVVALGMAASLGLASWCLLQIVQLRTRADVVETRVSVVEGVQKRYEGELNAVEKDGTPGFRTHTILDEQRDIELRTRLGRTEAALDRLTKVTEDLAVMGNDIRWIKAELERKKTL